MGCFLQASLALTDGEDASIVTRTVIVRSERIPKKLFRIFIELEDTYRNVVEQLVICAAKEGITSFIKLKALKYREMRNLYPHLPSHYVHTACQDASTRVKSFLKLKKEGSTNKEYPSVRRISIWLDDHLWRLEGLTRIAISTHRGLIKVDLVPHKQFYKYINSGWRLASEARIKLDRKERRLIIYLIFRKDVRLYKPSGYIAVDVNENNVAVLINRKVYLFETNIEKITLGYYYRRKRVQEKYDKIYDARCRAKRKILRKLREEEKKDNTRWKVANIIVREALKHGYGVVLEDLGDKPAENMISRIRDEQLRHRIFQAAFKGIQRAIEEKAKEHSVPVIYVNPRNTSKQCPIHRSEIKYNGSRIGICSLGREKWHRDVVACYNLLLKALGGDGSSAPSHPGFNLDGSHMPFGSTAAHEPMGIKRSLWARLKSLDIPSYPGTNGLVRFSDEMLKRVHITGLSKLPIPEDEETRRRLRGWLLPVKFDVGLSFFMVFIVTMPAVILTIEVLRPMHTAPSGLALVAAQVAWLTQTLGPWAGVIWWLGAFFALWGTFYSLHEVYMWTIYDMLRGTFRKAVDITPNKVRLYLWPYLVIVGSILFITGFSLPMLAAFATAATHLFALALWGIALLYLNMRYLPKPYRPHIVVVILATIGIAVYLPYGIIQLIQVFIPTFRI